MGSGLGLGLELGLVIGLKLGSGLEHAETPTSRQRGRDPR